MKPIILVLSAFGSYGGCETISFQDVQQGIFLITGDTGAGKTTIFDGITYALYDRTSGGRRDGSMMRSQYADSGTQTFVEYTFSYRGEVYVIRRSPEYYRPGKRKNADASERLVKEAAKVELILPGEKLYTGRKKEIDQKIEEIMGLDAEQFTSIAMIAQGDFLKLLHAESKERKKIFSKIFHTRLYYRMQEQLKERAKQLAASLEDNHKDCMREIEQVTLLPDSLYQEQWKTAALVERESLLKLIIQEGKERGKALTQRMNACAAQVEALNEKIHMGETVNRLLASLQMAKEKEAELEQQEAYMKEAEAQLIRCQKAEQVNRFELPYQQTKKARETSAQIGAKLELWLEEHQEAAAKKRKQEIDAREAYEAQEPRLHRQIVRLQDALPRYEIQNVLRQDWEKGNQSYLKILEEWESLTGEVKRLQAEREAIAKEQDENADCKSRGERMKAECEQLEALSIKAQELLLLEDGCRKEQQRAEEETARCKAAQERYEAVSEAFFREQAGILAGELVENQPCPVCGSLHHPRKACLPEDAPDQKTVNRAKEQRKTAEEAREDARTRYLEVKKTLHMERELVLAEGKRLFKDHFPMGEEEPIGEGVNAVFIMSMRRQKQEDYQKVQKQVTQFEQNEVRLAHLQPELEQKQIKSEEKAAELQGAKLQVRETEIKLDNLAKELPFSSLEEAKIVLLKNQNLLSQYKREKERTAAELSQLIEESKQKEGRLKNEAETRSRLKQEEENQEAQYRKAVKTYGFADEKEYQRQKQKVEQVEGLAEKVNAYRAARGENKAVRETLLLQTQDKEPVDLETERTQLEQMVETSEALRKEDMQLFGIHEKNKEAKMRFHRSLEAKADLQKTYEVLNNLSRTANGMLSGSVKMDFETYVQRQYFKQIIRAANKRLARMTSNEFILQCREVKDLGSQGQVGLDLDVYHLANDAVRDVKTLSGGESFLAALSMALGLSDIIQNTAGAIHLDTMFVDEGFGSLDDDARAQAMKVLQELAGEKSLVGIISHVNELKEQMDQKLVVRKTEKGSHVHWESAR